MLHKFPNIGQDFIKVDEQNRKASSEVHCCNLKRKTSFQVRFSVHVYVWLFDYRALST